MCLPAFAASDCIPFCGFFYCVSILLVPQDLQQRFFFSLACASGLAWLGWERSSVRFSLELGVHVTTGMQVLDFELQRQLVSHMKDLEPLPGIYDADFIAANQDTRATNVIKGTRSEQVQAVREHIRSFQADNAVDKVIVLWTANTERFGEVSACQHVVQACSAAASCCVW